MRASEGANVSVSQAGQWYWCLDHNRVEEASEACRPDRCMGPYETREEARNWREKVEARNEAWDEEDRRWEGED
jgi:hypothetical protein